MWYSVTFVCHAGVKVRLGVMMRESLLLHSGSPGHKWGFPIIPIHTWGDPPSAHDGDEEKRHDGTGKMVQWLGRCTTLYRGSKFRSQDPESSQPAVTPALRDPMPSSGL